jgi:hypothetical protein
MVAHVYVSMCDKCIVVVIAAVAVVEKLQPILCEYNKLCSLCVDKHPYGFMQEPGSSVCFLRVCGHEQDNMVTTSLHAQESVGALHSLRRE